jgi:hypothetical protein
MFKPITVHGFETPQSEFKPGPAPQLLWIDIKDLVIDPSYQREIGRRGAANVRQIVENFDWSKFAPVIVAPVEGGQYAVVDGQHRTTAALLRGLEKVPCQVVQADRSQQAAAFAAVNGAVTKTTSQQLYHARLAARHPEATALQEVLDAAGVQIVKTNLVLSKMKVGQAHCVSALLRCLRAYGPATLITSLQCITQTADGNAGFLRASLVEGICEVLHKNRRWCEAGDALLRAMDEISFPDLWEKATVEQDKVFPTSAAKSIAELVTAHLVKTLGSGLRQPVTSSQHIVVA